MVSQGVSIVNCDHSVSGRSNASLSFRRAWTLATCWLYDGDGDAGGWGVRIIRIMWMSLFTFAAHKKSHNYFEPIYGVLRREKIATFSPYIWAGQPELLTLYFSHLPYPISVTVHCLYHITWTLLMSFWIVNSFALCHVLGWILFVRRLFPSHIFKYSFLLETFLSLSR